MPTPDASPPSRLQLHPTFDAVFACDLCDFIASGPTPLEAHILSAHSVPVEAVNAIPVHAASAEPVTPRRGRPRKRNARS